MGIKIFGTGFLGTLTIVFVIAKILGYISWSWWWIFSPIWIPILSIIIILLFIISIALGVF